MSVFGKSLETSLEKSAAHAHSVNRYVVAQQLLQHGVIVIHIKLWAVHAIGNQKNNLPPLSLRITVLEQLRRSVHRIIQCLGRLALDVQLRAGHVRRISNGRVPVNRRVVADGRARRPRGRLIVQMRPLQLGEEFVLVADEAFRQVEKLDKSADEGLIVQGEAGNHGPQTFTNLLGILRLQVVVNQQNHGNGNRFRSEVNDLLFYGILEDSKFVSPQAGDQPPGPVIDGDGHHNLVDRESNSALPVLLRKRRRVLSRSSGGSARLGPLRTKLGE